MVNNIEKFGTPKSMNDLELEEGLADYEEEKNEAVTEETRKKTQKALEKHERERAEEKELWQKRVNELFQSGNFDEIKTLLRARPELTPNPEIVQARLNELITTRPSNWERIFSDIRSISDVRPDSAVVKKEFSALFAQFGNEKNILDQLKAFKNTTGFSPTQEQVQEKYRDILKEQKSYSFDTEDLIKDIKFLTGIQPDKTTFQEIMDRGNIVQAKKLAPIFGLEVTSEMVQQTYEAQFAKNGYLDTYRMSEIGENPNANLVTRAYQRILEKREGGWINSLKSLEQTTGVKPTFSEEQMRPIFEEFLQRGWYGQKGYVGISDLVEMTGLKPSAELVEKAALKIVDDKHGYIDQGKRIKEGLARLKEGIVVDFEIPESEIQTRYQKAIADKKAHVVNNLYGALGIRPKIDNEEARQFMVAFMDEIYHNPIAELEKTFGVKFKATKEEVEAKQDENLEKLNFDRLTKIKKLTGKDCDNKKLETTLIQWLEKQVAIPSDKRNSYDTDWEKKIKQRLEQFGVTIPQEVALRIYTGLVQNETIHSSNLIKVHQLTGVPIPPDLAQQAYRKFLSPDYAYSVKTGQGSSTSFGSPPVPSKNYLKLQA